MSLRLCLSIAATAFLAAALHAANVTVFAAASLTDVMGKLAANYQPASGDHLTFNFAGSGQLALQIENGAPADVFFSADEIQMNKLARSHLIDATTRTSLLSNTLVIIVPKGGPAALPPTAFVEPAIKRIALADPAIVPAGVYAKKFLEKQGLWTSIQAKVVPTVNVRAALAAVASGNVDAGMVYKTDASISKAVTIAYEIPRTEGPAISYPVALVTDAPDAAAAKKFLTYLESPEAMAVFKAYGFLPLAPPPATK